jgi:hypothetical protein
MEYNELVHVAKLKDLQKIYVIKDGIVTFVITQDNTKIISRIKYEDTEEFRINFLAGALKVNDVIIEEELLIEIRNLKKQDYEKFNKHNQPIIE